MGTLAAQVTANSGQPDSALQNGDLIRGQYANGESNAEVGFAPSNVTDTDVIVIAQEAAAALQAVPLIEDRDARDKTNNLFYIRYADESAAPAATNIAAAILPIRGNSISTTSTESTIIFDGGIAVYKSTGAVASVSVNVGRLLPQDRVIAKLIDTEFGGGVASDVYITRTNSSAAGVVVVAKVNGQDFYDTSTLNLVVIVLYANENTDGLGRGKRGFFGPYDFGGTGTIPSGSASCAVSGVPYVDENCVVITTLTTNADTSLTSGLCEVRASRTIDWQNGALEIGTAAGGNTSADVTFEYVVLHK